MTVASLAGQQRLEDINRIEKDRHSLAMSGTTRRIDQASNTWITIRQFLEDRKEMYLSELRSKNTELGGTNYARGALDAIDSLLDFAANK